jgi:predicted dehydrogenase
MMTPVRIRLTDAVLRFAKREVIIPDIQLNEPLVPECLHCIECVVSGRQPLTDGHDGINVMIALEAALQSMRQNSVCVPVSWPVLHSAMILT